MQSVQPTARSSRFRGVIILKKSAGRRLRRRPWIYVMAAGSVWCPYKKKYEDAGNLSADTQHSFRLKKRNASASKLPAANIFLLYGQYLNLPVANTITDNQYTIYITSLPSLPSASQIHLGDFFYRKLQYMVCFMLFIYYILLFIIYYYISPRIPDLKQPLYREKK